MVHPGDPTDSSRSTICREFDVTIMEPRVHSDRASPTFALIGHHPLSLVTIRRLSPTARDVINQGHDLSLSGTRDRSLSLFRTRSYFGRSDLRGWRMKETVVSTGIMTGDGVSSNSAMPLIAKRTLVSARSFTRPLASAPARPATTLAAPITTLLGIQRGT